MMETLKRVWLNVTAPAAYSREDNPVLWNQLDGGVDLDKALSFSAFWRGVNYLSGVISALPWTLQERNANTGAAQRRTGHKIDYMLSMRANPNMTASAWRQTTLAHRITQGAGFSEIQRSIDGRPVALWPIQPDRVEVKVAPDRSLVFMVRNGDGSKVPIMPEAMLYFPGLSFDGVNGYSVLHCARRTIEAGVAGDEFATALWKNSAMVGGMVSHPQTLSDTAFNRLRQQFQERYVGATKRGTPIIGEEGLTFTPFAIPPEDAQFLENRQFTIEDCARWLGIPPHKMMDNRNATYSNVEEQNLEVIGDTIVPIIEALEQEANYKLLGPQQSARMFTAMDVSKLARGNFKARSEWLRAGFDMGGVSPNRVAEEFGEPPTPGGENRFVQMNLQTVAMAAKPPEPPAPVIAPPDEPGPADADAAQSIALAMLANCAASVERVQAALVDRYGEADAAAWCARAAKIADKAVLRLAPAVEAAAAALEVAPVDANLILEQWASAEQERFTSERTRLDVSSAAAALLEALSLAAQLAIEGKAA